MIYTCPICKKQFDELYEVHSSSGEPMTATPYDPIEGLRAFAAYSVPKELVCHVAFNDNKPGYTHIRFPDGEERLIKVIRFDIQALAQQKQNIADHPQTCDEEGCNEEGIPCYISQLDTEPNGWYCDKHAASAGFCSWCGIFSAGIESFDFNPNGLCAGCQDQLDSELEYESEDLADWELYDYFDDQGY